MNELNASRWHTLPADTAPAAPMPVKASLSNWTEALCEVTTDADADGRADGAFEATPNHALWAAGRGWTACSELRAGDRLRTPRGTPVAVHSVRVFNRNCATWNLAIGELHDFFVLSGASPVLAHNTNVDEPRAWVVYQARWFIDGQEYVYTGKASMKCKTKDFNARKVLKQRYEKFGDHCIRRGPGVPSGELRMHIDDLDILEEVWDDGKMSTLTANKGKRIKTEVEAAIHGAEGLADAKVRLDGHVSLNKKRPLDLSRPDASELVAKARTLLTRKGARPIPCAFHVPGIP